MTLSPLTVAPPDPNASPTERIVDSLTRAIVEHRLQPGSKLAEQKLADQFGVSRTLVRQALFQMAKNHLIRLEPARGAFVATPSADEARQVFAVRRMLELEMTRAFLRQVTPAQIAALRNHVQQERQALAEQDVRGRTELLGVFHVRMAELMGNTVLAQLLTDLISRCALIALMYQSSHAAAHSSDEHGAIVDALEQGNEELVLARMAQHLQHVEEDLQFDRPPPSHDIVVALS
jgi:DNA-binding GntR family transcriptional regulator